MSDKNYSLAAALMEIELHFGRGNLNRKEYGPHPKLHGPLQNKFMEQTKSGMRGEAGGGEDFYNPRSSGYWGKQNEEFRKKRLGL